MSYADFGSAEVQTDAAAGIPLRSNEGLTATGTEMHGGQKSGASPEPITELNRHIVTCRKNRHQFFWFSSRRSKADPTLVHIASDDAFHLGVLSSMIHITWIRTVGGMAQDTPVYNEDRCFAPFPFPDSSPDSRKPIAELAERLDQHRKNAMAADDRVAMTAIYDVVTKLRSTTVFTPDERIVARVAEGRVLREMHQELDRLVARAYGWRWPMNKQQILKRLVELHDARVEEERAGTVRWLRPEYQNFTLGTAATE
jgi:hypothetical protein